MHVLAVMAGTVVVHPFVCWMIAGFDQTRLPTLARGLIALFGLVDVTPFGDHRLSGEVAGTANDRNSITPAGEIRTA